MGMRGKEKKDIEKVADEVVVVKRKLEKVRLFILLLLFLGNDLLTIYFR